MNRPESSEGVEDRSGTLSATDDTLIAKTEGRTEKIRNQVGSLYEKAEDALRPVAALLLVLGPEGLHSENDAVRDKALGWPASISIVTRTLGEGACVSVQLAAWRDHNINLPASYEALARTQLPNGPPVSDLTFTAHSGLYPSDREGSDVVFHWKGARTYRPKLIGRAVIRRGGKIVGVDVNELPGAEKAVNALTLATKSDTRYLLSALWTNEQNDELRTLYRANVQYVDTSSLESLSDFPIFPELAETCTDEPSLLK